MLKIITLTLMLFTSVSAFAAKVKQGGTVYVCATADNVIKITADLSDDKNERSVKTVVDGITKLYYERKNKKQMFEFMIGAVKNSTLQVRKNKHSPILISLETEPENSHFQLAHSGEGVTVNKFDSFLTIPALKVKRTDGVLP